MNGVQEPVGAPEREVAPEFDEFYVGYLPAPAGVARFARRATEMLAALTIVVAVAVSAAQAPPGSGAFPSAVAQNIPGVVFRTPVPLFLHTGEDGAHRWLLLVGEFKRGPDERAWRAPAGAPTLARGRIIGVPGEDSPGCLELAPGEDAIRPAAPALGSAESMSDAAAPERPLGRVTLRGQIIDPKCFFGAMKPGEGKVHRGCAVRCISGGVPPVLMVRERAAGVGERDVYYILVRADGLPVNEAVLDFVAEPVEITGEASRLVAPDGRPVGDDSLRVLRFDPATIRRL